MTPDQDLDELRCRALYRALLKRALDDLNALWSGASIPNGDTGRPMGVAEREELLMSTFEWFVVPDSSPVSLDVVCDTLNLDAESIRAKARRLVHGDLRAPHLRRRKLSPAIRVYVLDSLARGSTTREIAQELSINPATCRKIRIKARRAELARGLTQIHRRTAVSQGAQL
jgi:transposase-like protein